MKKSTQERRMSISEDPLESRSNPRVGADIPVDIHSSEFSGILQGRTRDLSVGGACIATASPFTFKSVHRIVLTLPEVSLPLEATGCWQLEEPSEDLILTGVSFDHPSPEALEALWSRVLESGKELARFLYERSDIHELGLEEAMGLAQVSRYRHIPAGQTIYRQGTTTETSDSLFLVFEGSVTLQLRIRDAIEQPIGQLGPGELFGGLPLIANAPHCESAVTDSNTRLLEIDRSAFRYLRTAKPWLAHRLGAAILRTQAMRLHRILGHASKAL